MRQIVECVPNFSEGRDKEIISALGDSVKDSVLDALVPSELVFQAFELTWPHGPQDLVAVVVWNKRRPRRALNDGASSQGRRVPEAGDPFT